MTLCDWNALFADAFKSVTDDLTKFYEQEPPDKISPNERAILTGLGKLPFPVRIVDVSVDSKTHTHLQDDTSQLIYYDLKRIGKNQVDYLGRISPKKDDLASALVRRFGLSESDSAGIAASLMPKFEYTGFPLDDGTHVQFTFYDIKSNPDKFYGDFHRLFTSWFNDYFIDKYNTEAKIDFNDRYGMKPDAVVSAPDLLAPDPRTRLSLEKLQEAVASMQLSPKVPEPVRVEFQRAKDLFVFSYFKYDFITLSVRSAVFSHEVAMKSRYVQSLGGRAVLKCGSDTVGELTDPSYSGISDHIFEVTKAKKYRQGHILVNGERFPRTVDSVMAWLIKNGIPEWKFGMYNAVRKIRNSMAYPERAIIFHESSSVNILRNVAYDINEMFEL